MSGEVKLGTDEIVEELAGSVDC